MTHTDMCTIRAAIVAQLPLSHAQQVALLAHYDRAAVDRDLAASRAEQWKAEYDRAVRDLAGWVRLSAGA